MNAPLYKKLIEYSDSKLTFHMPGHKFGTIADLDKINLTLLDNTEAIGMDNLYEAEGIIEEAMCLMANFYGAKKTLFLTNGSTAGILASILAICKEGDRLIVARNAHHSVWSALILAGVEPVYISPQYLEEEDLLGEITLQSVEQAMEAYPDVKGVLLVSPTYEGIVSDIQAISDYIHRHNKILIVDEAHGAHFVLDESFPKSSINSGGDIVINSMHKTLPTLTQSGLLHICSDRVSYETVVASLRMIQTSSPSYMMMGVMDYIRDYILKHRDLIKKQYVDELKEMRNRLKELKVLHLIEGDHKCYDISKIIISAVQASISGYKLAELLNERYDIVVEAALENYIILMTTMADHAQTLSRLEQALKEIDSELEKCVHIGRSNNFLEDKVILGTSPRKIHYGQKNWKTIEECINKKSAQNIMLYPPGIPILCLGEAIEERHIEIIKCFKNKLQGIKVIDEVIYLNVAD